MKSLRMSQRGRRSRSTTASQSARQGSFLVQCIVVMTMLSIIMTISGTALFRLFRQQSDLSVSIAHSALLSRLARDFRADAHAAQDVTVAGDGGREIVFRNGTGLVTWSVGTGLVTRATRDGQATDVTQPTESTRLPEMELRFEVLPKPTSDQSTDSPRVRMTLLPTAQAKFHVVTTTTIDAAVGLNHRFEKPANGS